MTSREHVETQIRSLLAEHLQQSQDPADLPGDVTLFGGGLGLDSMSAVHLMTAIEETFDLRIEDDEFDAFENINSLVAYVLSAGKS